MSVPGRIFRLLLYPLYKKNHVEFEEDGDGKMGFATLMTLKCTGKKCKFLEKFYSFLRVGTCQAFEVNRRIVLVGHHGLVKCARTMNMPPPVNENSYRGYVDATGKTAQTVCQQSTRTAAEDVKKFYEPEEDGVFEIGISGDGTWKRRGYASIVSNNKTDNLLHENLDNISCTD